MKSFSKKGVTIIELVVVIIILILLAVIAILNTKPTQEKAEYTAILSEFKAVYTAVNTIKDMYNQGYDLVEGVDYCTTANYGSGEVWYVVYGLQDYNSDESLNKYNEEIVMKRYGVDELKRSYEFRILNSNVINQDDVEVRYYDGRVANVAGFDVRTYEDVKSIKNDIAR